MMTRMARSHGSHDSYDWHGLHIVLTPWKTSGRFFFFMITQMQSVSILSDDLCLSMFLLPFDAFLKLFFKSFKWLLHRFVLPFGHFGCHKITSFGMFKLRNHGRKTFRLNPNISSVVDLEAQYSSAFRQNLSNLPVSWPIQCQWDLTRFLCVFMLAEPLISFFFSFPWPASLCSVWWTALNKSSGLMKATIVHFIKPYISLHTRNRLIDSSEILPWDISIPTAKSFGQSHMICSGHAN